MQHVQHLQSGRVVPALDHAICGWSRLEPALVVDSLLVECCNTVLTVMRAKLGTWWCRQMESRARVDNEDAGSAMHQALGCPCLLVEFQENNS